MLDLNTFIFISVAVALSLVGLVVWIADSGVSDKYKSLLSLFVIAVALGLAGLFFMIDDDSEFEYAGYEKIKVKKGGGKRGSMVEEGGGGGDGPPKEQQKGNGGGDGSGDGSGEGEGEDGANAGEAKEVATEVRDCPVCPEMVVIPAGMALLGSTHQILSGGLKSGPASQKNFRRSFSIGRYEVTVDEFQAFVDEVNYTPTGNCRGSDGSGGALNYLAPGFGQRPRNPVVCVNWTDASRYTVWLSVKTGKTYRLPTEAEWEYAARAGVTQTYMTGEELSSRVANFRSGRGAVGNGTRAVGTYGANGNGMFDVHGNVWEIVGDCWSKYYQVADVGGAASSNAIDCSRRIVKGGGWSSPTKQTAFPMRGAIPNDLALNSVGFRVMHQ